MYMLLYTLANSVITVTNKIDKHDMYTYCCVETFPIISTDARSFQNILDL